MLLSDPARTSANLPSWIVVVLRLVAPPAQGVARATGLDAARSEMWSTGIDESTSEGWTMTESIYRVTEVIGTSTTSWEDAARNAVETAAESLRDLRVGEVVKLDLTIEDGKVAHYRARVNISFKYEHE
jgi:flavin-binding protein dodecin